MLDVLIKQMFSTNPNYKLISKIDQINLSSDNFHADVYECENVSNESTLVNYKDTKRLISRLPLDYKRSKEAYHIVQGIKSQLLIKFADSFVCTDENYFYTINLNEVSLFI